MLDIVGYDMISICFLFVFLVILAVHGGYVDEKNLEDSLKILRHLKKGLDTDGSGHVTNEEMEDGVALLTKLMPLAFRAFKAFKALAARTEKAQNSSEMPYKHLPEQIQEVMREWDADGSGMVGVSELSAAANAYRKVLGFVDSLFRHAFGMLLSLSSDVH